jgi:hypothetical protein
VNSVIPESTRIEKSILCFKSHLDRILLKNIIYKLKNVWLAVVTLSSWLPTDSPGLNFSPWWELERGGQLVGGRGGVGGGYAGLTGGHFGDYEGHRLCDYKLEL